MSEILDHPAQLKLAQYASDEFLEGKKVRGVLVNPGPHSLKLCFEDGTETNVFGAIAAKIKKAR